MELVYEVPWVLGSLEVQGIRTSLGPRKHGLVFVESWILMSRVRPMEAPVAHCQGTW